MKNNISDEELWRIIGYLKGSPAHYKTLKTLKKNFSIPSEISKKAKLTPSQVSISLHDLKKHGLVICLNEDAVKGKIYQSTDLGLEVIEIIEKQLDDLN